MEEGDAHDPSIWVVSCFFLLPKLRGIDVVTESGIATPVDVARMRAAGVHRFLIGESLMRQPSPGMALENLVGQ